MNPSIHLDWWHWAAAAGCVCAAVAWTVTAFLLRRHVRRTACYVHIAAPPQVDARTAAVMWRHLHTISYPRHTRLFLGRPHVVWEYAFTGRVLDIRVWVPGGVHPAVVCHAIDAAWPGATTTITRATTDTGKES